MRSASFAVFLLAVAAASGQSWVPLESGSRVSLRGLAALDAHTVWASGTNGTVLRSSDGGRTWSLIAVPGAEALDFRDVHVADASTVFLSASGPGAASRFFKTTDGGRTWRATFENPDANGFFDAIAFRDPKHGVLLGDPVNGRFTVFTTEDGGENWQRQETPAAVNGEGAFAASGTCLIVAGKNAWFGTGGPGGGRVFRSSDGGKTWNAIATTVRNDSPSAGIFALGAAEHRVIAVGGDYRKPGESQHNAALSSDDGKTWSALPGLDGYQSAVIYSKAHKAWIATGLGGSSISTDDGRTWQRFDSTGYHSLAAAGGEVWAAGPQGRLARLQWR